MRIDRIVCLVLVALAVSGVAPPVTAAASSWRVFTLIGSEYDPHELGTCDFSLFVGPSCANHATRIRVDGPDCVAALTDGAIAACLDGAVVRLDRAGSLRPWLARPDATPGALPRPWGHVVDIVPVMDGGIVAVSDSGLWRAAPGESAVQIAGAAAAGTGVAMMPDGSAVIADGRARVLQVLPDGSVRPLAGTGEAGFSGDGGPAVNARLTRPCDVAVHSRGVVIAECHRNGRIRQVTANGRITTIAGGGHAGAKARRHARSA